MGILSWMARKLWAADNAIAPQDACLSVEKKKRKPRRQKEEIEAERDRIKVRIGEKFRARSVSEKERQTNLGITHYIWSSCGDSSTCDECAKNNGKKFSWNNPPKTGHPGEGLCCPKDEVGYCRCAALACVEELN